MSFLLVISLCLMMFAGCAPNGSSSGSTPNAVSLEKLNENYGRIAMGKTGDSTVDNVDWLCFAYSQDNIHWERYNSTTTTLTKDNAKYLYFVLDTYVLGRDKYLNSSKVNTDTYKHSDSIMVNGAEVSLSDVNVNDYYYRDIRQAIRDRESTLTAELNISEDNPIYNAIVGRTLEDLYKNNKFTRESSNEDYVVSDMETPTVPSTDMSVADKFWLLSMDEVQNFFDGTKKAGEYPGRRWSSTNRTGYWLRSGKVNDDYRVGKVSADGGCGSTNVKNSDLAPRIAFKLQIV